MRIGFATVPRWTTSAVLTFYRAGEEAGYDAGWMPDQTFYHDPFALLGALAHFTHQLRLGIAVTNPYTRHPGQLARAAGTLDQLSGGRFVLGIGAGNRLELIEKLGIPHTAIAARCREAAVVVKELLTGRVVDHDGHYPLRRVRLESPVRAGVPVWLASRAPLTLEAAGAVADGVIIESLLTSEGIRYALGHVRRGAQSAGRKLEDLSVMAWGLAFVARKLEDIPDSVVAMTAHIIGGTPTEVLTAIGFDPDKVETLKRDYREGGPAGAAHWVEMADIERLTFVGEPDRLLERIQDLRSAGVTEIGFVLHSHLLEENLATLRLLADKVVRRIH